MKKKPKRHLAHIRYKLTDGTHVPGVTTVIGLRAKPELIKWANKLGLEGIDSTAYSSESMVIGTIVHEMILDYFREQMNGKE